MQVDEATVRRIARLARIKVTDAEAKALEGELIEKVREGEGGAFSRAAPPILHQRMFAQGSNFLSGSRSIADLY